MKQFTPSQLLVVNQSVALAEELVCDFFKMSATQWLRHRYDVKTYADLAAHEKIDGPFAQIARYACRKEGASLSSATYDFYQICLQDNAILPVVTKNSGLMLFPFVLYIIVHELIHIVRFAKFYQNFNASPEERLVEEDRVHKMTREIIAGHDFEGIAEVMDFYSRWEDDPQKIF